MARAGKPVVAGPLDDQPDPRLRGICLYRTTLEEARRHAEQDPAVKAGEKGAMTFPIADAKAAPRK